MRMERIQLYRVDGENPGATWSTSHKNPDYKDPTLGDKNSASLFFFTDSLEVAHDIYAYGKQEYFLTTCTATEIEIIDFKECLRIVQALNLLRDCGIDVLTEELFVYEDKINPFVTMKERFGEAYESIQRVTVDDPLERYKQTKVHEQILRFQTTDRNYDMSLFGQRLTDFSNGRIFANILASRGFDGYCWREHGDSRGVTFCFRNAQKLSAPTVTHFVR